jgi:putative phosphoesterase
MAKRRALFDDFAAYWADLGKSGYWDGLGNLIGGALRPDVGGPAKIALIGDVHANLPALEAVLEDARKRGAIAVLDAGDAVGYGPFPEETVGRLRRERVLSVVGNYDRQVLASRGEKKALPKDPEKRLAVLWAYEHLSKEGRSYLASLPEHLRLAPGGRRILLCHGSPESIDEYIDGETPASRLAEIAGSAGADVVVSGHAHRPSALEVGGVWFVNTGSVGRPDDGDPRACYALLQTDPLSVCHVRVPYDVERTVAAVFEEGLPPSFARLFREGRSLDALDGGEVSISCTAEEDRHEEG